MGIGKMILGAGVAAGGLFAGIKALENMSSDSIRDTGASIKDAVGNLSQSVLNSDIAKDLTEKINGTKYGPTILGALDSAGGALSNGFDKFVGILASSKESAEMGNGSLGSNLAEKLTGAVASGAEYIAEHIPRPESIGEAGGNLVASYLNGAQQTQSIEPAADAYEGPEL